MEIWAARGELPCLLQNRAHSVTVVRLPHSMPTPLISLTLPLGVVRRGLASFPVLFTVYYYVLQIHTTRIAWSLFGPFLKGNIEKCNRKGVDIPQRRECRFQVPKVPTSSMESPLPLSPPALRSQIACSLCVLASCATRAMVQGKSYCCRLYNV